MVDIAEEKYERVKVIKEKSRNKKREKRYAVSEHSALTNPNIAKFLLEDFGFCSKEEVHDISEALGLFDTINKRRNICF